MAEKITVNVPHNFTVQEAKSRIDGNFPKFQQTLGGFGGQVEREWLEDTMTFSLGIMGQSLTGKLQVQEKTILVEIDLPWILAKLSGGLQDKLKQGAQILLEKK